MSWNTYKTTGEWVHNNQVIMDIKCILSEEFVDYRYHKVTYALKQDYEYLINHKKIYDLMSDNQLLNKYRYRSGSKRAMRKRTTTKSSV
ncbi:MAG: hypothetical protein WBC35_19685 [Saprospiraceae bacterium]